MRWLVALLQEGYVLETWGSEGRFYCLVSKGDSTRQIHGEGRSLRAAIEEAVQRWKEDEHEDR